MIQPKNNIQPPKCTESPHLPCAFAFIEGVVDSLFHDYDEREVTVIRKNPQGIPSPSDETCFTSPFVRERLKALEQFCLNLNRKWKDVYYPVILQGVSVKEEHKRLNASQPMDSISAERKRMNELRLLIRLKEIDAQLQQAEDDLKQYAHRRKLIYEKQLQSYYHGYHFVLNILKARKPYFPVHVYTDGGIEVISPEIASKVYTLHISGAEDIHEYAKNL